MRDLVDRLNKIRPFDVSLGDAIDLEQNFKRFGNRLRFQSKIRDKFGSGLLLVTTTSIKSATNIIEKLEFNQKVIEFLSKLFKIDPKSLNISFY